MPKEPITHELGRTSDTAEADRIKGMQILSDALDGQRNRAEDLWNAATAKTSWVPGRDVDRRINAMSYEPERRHP